MIELVAAMAAFVGTHFLLSHPLRAPLVRRIGDGAFLGVYSLVAFATLGWAVYAFRTLPAQAPLWDTPEWGWALATAAMLLASVLIVGSLIANPAAPDSTGPRKPPGAARGVYAITRHPMMWSFTIWAAAHAGVWPTASNLVVTAGVALLALGGAAGQDRKKAALLGADWTPWAQATSFLPFAALAGGRARWPAALPPAGILIGGLLLWFAVTWAHPPLGAPVPAGIWRWLR